MGDQDPIGLLFALAIVLGASVPPAVFLVLVFLGAVAIAWSARRGEVVSTL